MLLTLRLGGNRLALPRSATMPLRARINPTMGSRNAFARPYTSAAEVKELPDDEPNDVLFGQKYGVRTITLNRPKKLNSLNGSMARKICGRMAEWDKSQMANVIIAKGEGRAFCAGGDVAALAQQCEKGPEGRKEAKDYFALEYKLDHMIATCQKPYVAFIDGITMGGGVGLSVHAPIRIATENTVFAMPETTIGFFPDVGASFFLPRMDGRLGAYLALTSEQLKGIQVFYAGIATHYLHSSSLPDLEARLGELQFQDHDSLDQRLRTINSTIEEFTTGIPHDAPLPGATGSPIGGNIRIAIDYAFQDANRRPENILDALEGLATMQIENDQQAEVVPWAKKTMETITKRSPTSVAVALRQLDDGRRWSITETFRKEHQLASHFMEHPDFVEGVSSLLIRKPKTDPQWKPASFKKVSDSNVDAFFNAKSDWTPFRGNDRDYHDYPHNWTGLPKEREVEQFVKQGNSKDKESVVQHFVDKTNGKMGVREKLSEIVDRKTELQDGSLTWKK